MAIFKTRKHNDDPTAYVVELYNDDGTFITDAVCYSTVQGLCEAVFDLFIECSVHPQHCPPEQLTS